MRKGALLILLAGLFVLPLNLRADVFASGIRFTNPDDSPFDGSVGDGTGLKVHFLLNDTATSIAVRIHKVSDNAVVHTINLSNLSKGWQSATWNGTGSAGSVSYYVTIEATQPPYSSSVYTAYNAIITRGGSFAIFSRGVDVVRTQSNPDYGFLYTSNAGGFIGRGFARYNASGGDAGTAPPNPFLANSTANTDGVQWSGTASAPIHATTDSLGRVYASDFDLGEIWRMTDTATAPKRIISGLFEPKGLAVRGSGANLKLYIAAGNYVLRANLGTEDTLTTALDTIASLGTNVRDVIFDDLGFMYVNLRSGTGFDGTSGLATERYNISGTLPVTRGNALFTLTWTGRPIGLGHWGGPNQQIVDDDILYISVRSDATTDLPGIYRVTDVGSPFFPTVQHIFKPDDLPGGGGGDISSRADLTVDPAGNVVVFENGNEEIIFLSPPSSAGTVSHTTRSPSTFTLGPTSAERIEDKLVPDTPVLEQNYPNPFNPSTTIEFSVADPGPVTLRVYDALGRQVKTLVDGLYETGRYKVRFNSDGLPSGVYFYTLVVGTSVETRKMVFMK